jgi:basic amino acid/polyamine antiporter, APA family
MSAPVAKPSLLRTVSRWELVGVSINGVVGSGIYLLPAAAALMLGPASVWAIVAAGIAVGLMVLCFAEASSYFDEPGGGYLYTREAFGSLAGFLVGWMTWLARIAGAAALLNGFALAMLFLWPAASGGIARATVMAVPLLVLTWVNLIGVKYGARTSVAFILVKMVPLLLFVGVGIFHVDWTRVVAVQVPAAAPMAQAGLLLLFAYAGFENTPAAAGEYRNPRRDAPFALITTIVVVTLLYAAVQVVALGSFPGLAAADSPLAEAAGAFMGPAGALLLTAGAAVAIVGTLSSTLLFAPRYLFALALDGFGPRSLADVHPRFRTPHVSILFGGALILVLALSGSFVQLALLSVVARMATVLGTVAAVPVLRRRFAARPDAFVLPGGVRIPALAFIVTLAFLASTTRANLIAAAVALAVGVVIYRFRRRDSSAGEADGRAGEQPAEPMAPVALDASSGTSRDSTNPPTSGGR